MHLYLKNQTALTSGDRPLKILHIGPEFCLQPVLAAMPNATYVSADLMSSLVDLLEVKPDVCMSVTRGCFPSDAFDLVICSHVLEHVDADREAMVELFRMIKPGGLAIVPVPVAWDCELTDERTGLSPSQRAECYGEADHLRMYGRDYLDRLREVGFAAVLYRLDDPSLAMRYRIDLDDPLIVAQKRPISEFSREI
jgi:SAM-dependent methyltransferase